jgi:hypothetical protein
MEGGAVFSLDARTQRLLTREHAERLREDARRPVVKRDRDRPESERISFQAATKRAAAA